MHLEEVDLASKGPILEYTEALRVVSMVVGAVNFLCDAAWCLVSALVVFSFKGAHAQSSRERFFSGCYSPFAHPPHCPDQVYAPAISRVISNLPRTRFSATICLSKDRWSYSAEKTGWSSLIQNKTLSQTKTLVCNRVRVSTVVSSRRLRWGLEILVSQCLFGLFGRFTKIHGSPALWRVGGEFLFKRHNVVGRFGLRYEMQVSYAQLDARSEDGR
ncbi:hypothetical protein IGI04_015023 [Brassica rapa subsp. trilocularis]|uniref:CASP-like protein n=1 Tax=Brassica rapa subsp. trilocularis TaxID=1813537 RepID=A0ABQ7MRX4_BRACM|nr:hypothetical protein IGI04_015023 [Brassica rapa subsp. trilocularis]